MLVESYLRPGEHPLLALDRARGQLEAEAASVAFEWDEWEFFIESLDDVTGDLLFEPDWGCWISGTRPTLYKGWLLVDVRVAIPSKVEGAIRYWRRVREEVVPSLRPT